MQLIAPNAPRFKRAPHDAGRFFRGRRTLRKPMKPATLERARKAIRVFLLQNLGQRFTQTRIGDSLKGTSKEAVRQALELMVRDGELSPLVSERFSLYGLERSNTTLAERTEVRTHV